MKKIKIILAYIFSLFLMSTVYAGTAYVDSIDIDAKINTDGSMTVKETVLWNIEEDLNGLYRDILIENTENRLNSASSIEIIEVVVDNRKFDYSNLTLQNGTDGKYNINTIQGGKQVKIFTPSSNEYKTTSITYTVYDVVIEYNDIAELYWNFIGSGWEYGIEDVNIHITLPGNSNTLKVFAHGPLYGYSRIASANSVILQVENLRSGEMVDARVLFETSLVNSLKKVNQDVLENILIEETILAEQANIAREYAQKAFYISRMIVIIAVAIPIIIYIVAYKKSFKASFKGKYYRELPEDYGPAIMNKVLYPTTGTASSYDMLATLLDLVRRKYVEIEPIVKNGKKKPTDYLLKLVNEDLTKLNKSEKHFVKNLIFVNTSEISLKELSKKNSKSMSAKDKAYKQYTKWTEIIEQIAKEKDLLKSEKVKIGKAALTMVVCSLASIAVIIYGHINNYGDVIDAGILGVFIGILELIGICLGLHELNVRTQKGVEHTAMWKAFKKFLLDFSKLDEYDHKSIVIWEHYLVYATAMGISKKVIKELKIVYPTEFEQGSNMLNTYTTIGLLSNNDTFSSFSNSFTSAASTAFSTPTSSNGSGGGFAGGAGGGRRRRWRRWILIYICAQSN